MSDPPEGNMTASAPPGAAVNDRPDRTQRWVWTVAGFGVVIALIGAIDGIAMALHRRVATCADGTYFPEGTTDFNCYTHPEAGLGIAVTCISVLLGILVVIGSIAAVAALAPSREARRSH